jgi:hypothetical protein
VELTGGLKYVVLDDLIEKCPPNLLKEFKKNKKHVKHLYENRNNGEPLEYWEVNKKCYRSIKYHHEKKPSPGLVSRSIKDTQKT